MTHPDESVPPLSIPSAGDVTAPDAELEPVDDPAAGELAADERDAEHPQPHPPFARSPEDYTDPPGHHRRGPHGPALDVGA